MTRKDRQPPARPGANRPPEKTQFNRAVLAKPSRIDRKPKRTWGRGRP